MTIISAPASALASALSAVMPAVSRKTKFPVESHVVVTAHPGGGVSLTSDGGDNVSMCATVEDATSEAPGSFTIAARELATMLKGAPVGASVTITPGTGTASVRMGALSASIASLAGREAPKPVFLVFTAIASMTFAADVLARALEVTAPAMSTEETRYYLNGVFMHPASEYEGGGVRFVATDGHRLVRHTVAMDAPGGDWRIIIPTAAACAIRKLISRLAKAHRSAPVAVDVSASGMRVTCGGVVVDVSGIDGTFPDYGRVVPLGNPHAVAMDRASFTSAIKAAAVAWNGRYAPVGLDIKASGSALASSVIGEVSASASLPCDLNGDAMFLGFNGRYMLDILASMRGDSVVMHFADPGAPLLLTEDDEATLYVVMPMRVSHFTPAVPDAPAICGDMPMDGEDAAPTETTAPEPAEPIAVAADVPPPSEEMSEESAAAGSAAEEPSPPSDGASPVAVMQGQVLEIRAGGFAGKITVGDISRNWDALSHVPDRRARFELEALAQRLTAFFAYTEGLREAAGLDATWQASQAEFFAARHLSLTRAAWAADGRCMSSFIVGPAKFPVASNVRRQASAENAQRELRDHLDNAREAVRRRAFPHGAPGDAIRADNPDAPVLIRDKIAEECAAYARAQSINAAVARIPRDLPAEEMAHRISEETGIPRSLAATVAQAMRSGVHLPMNPAGHLAEIKRLECRLSAIERNRSAGAPEVIYRLPNGAAVRMVEDGEAARIRLYFDGKPDAETRAEMKGRGFRWAPSEGAWQRHLNNPGRWAAEAALAKIGAIKDDATPSSETVHEVEPPSEAIPHDLEAPPPANIDVMGRTYRATATFGGPDAVDQANAYLADHPGEWVIAERGGIVWCARKDDGGTPAKAVLSASDPVEIVNIIALGAPPRCPDTPDMFAT